MKTNRIDPKTGEPLPRYKHRNHRRTGKVARLPAHIRHQIGLMITQYKQYREIIQWLESQGHPGISESNLSRWRHGGFQDWIAEQRRRQFRDFEIMLEVLNEFAEAALQTTPSAHATN